MNKSIFENTFKNLQIPVIVCRKDKSYPLVFMNASAKIVLNPSLPVEIVTGRASADYLSNVLRFSAASVFEGIMSSLDRLGALNDVKANIINSENESVSVILNANLISMGGVDYYVIYIQLNRDLIANDEDVVSIIMEISYNSASTDEAINRILAYLGECINVSRVYIFEDAGKEYTRNTYEWCGNGVAPAIQDLQDLRKDDYNYDVIIREGVYVTGDVRELPQMDRDILESQGIKAVAIVALHHADPPIGYIGFDDCEKIRSWHSGEMRLLKKAANIIVSLIERRNAEERASRSLEILKTISNNIDSIVYVNSIKDYELIFINEALADSMQKTADEILGEKCWRTLQKDQIGPCDFCPMNKMIDADGNTVLDTYVWEFQNTVNRKWFLVKDAIIKWIDGSDVHIETATEITRQKQYEEMLEYSASTDVMTGAYNREWGLRIMQNAVQNAAGDGTPMSLCFIDIDGLKRTNDTCGHDAGDDMIVSTVDAMRACVRKSDIISRWGGDEFILLVSCDSQRAEEIIKKIKGYMDKINESGGKAYKLSFSYGIVEVSGSGANTPLNSIITRADKLMYENKICKRGYYG